MAKNDEANFHYANDVKKVLELAKIIEDETKSEKVRNKAAADLLKEYDIS